MKLAIVGATGMVGRTMLQVLEERNVQITELFPVASEKSEGQEVFYKGVAYKTTTIEKVINQNLDFALFSAGGSISEEWAPKFAEKGGLLNYWKNSRYRTNEANRPDKSR
mgnify:CR=1 FL=1